LSMDDDGIAEITATLRFDRAILLFWYLFGYQLFKILYKKVIYCFATINDLFYFKLNHLQKNSNCYIY
jgi:hypothetical protein